MEDAKLQVAHYGIVSVEMVKNNRRYQLMVPLGAAWEEAEQTCDDFKLSLQEMKRSAKEQADKLQKEKDEAEAKVEPLQEEVQVQAEVAETAEPLAEVVEHQVETEAVPA